MKPSGINDMAAPKGAPDLMMALAAPGGEPADGGQAGPQLDPTQDCVPLASLNMPDETEQMQSPEVGDKVQFTKEGTVDRIEGDHAYIKVESVNGQPVEGSDDDETDPENPAEDQAEAEQNGGGDDAKGLQDLQDMAGKMGALNQ